MNTLTNNYNMRFLTLIFFIGYSFFTISGVKAENTSATGNLFIDQIECSEWGPDSAFTVREYSLYRTHFDQENYNLALPHWRYVFVNAPAIRQRLHIDGTRMYKDFIANAEGAVKEAFIDTLFMIYDLRLKCFGDNPEVMGYKASDMYSLRPSDMEAVRKTFEQMIDLAGNDSRHFFLLPYMVSVIRAERAGHLTKEEVVQRFERIIAIIDHNVQKGNEVAGFNAARDRIEPLVSDYMDCETLLPMVKRNYPNNKENADQLNRMFNQLRMARCTDDPIFMEVLKSLNKVDPSAENSFRIANSLSTSGNLRGSIPYYQKAAELETEGAKKAEYLLELAKVYRRLEDFPQSRNFARQASALRPNWGEPFILIGDLYASSGPLCGSGTGFESQVVVWAAIDMYERAKAVDGSAAAEANSRIARYEKFMPARGELFMRSLNEGDTFKINCWINENTIVRVGPSN
jgi:tetratricopeptide (TPR) repeat protein